MANDVKDKMKKYVNSGKNVITWEPKSWHVNIILVPPSPYIFQTRTFLWWECFQQINISFSTNQLSEVLNKKKRYIQQWDALLRVK